jgi:hypothetical protein
VSAVMDRQAEAVLAGKPCGVEYRVIEAPLDISVPADDESHMGLRQHGVVIVGEWKPVTEKNIEANEVDALPPKQEDAG